MDGYNQFKVGDIVRLRAWDELKQEFGISGGSIQCFYDLPREMYHELFGKEWEITKIEDVVYFGHGKEQRWSVTYDMIELVPDEELDDTAEELDDFLNNINLKSKEVL